MMQQVAHCSLGLSSILSVNCTFVSFLLHCKMKPGVTLCTSVQLGIRVGPHMLTHIVDVFVLVVAVLTFYRITDMLFMVQFQVTISAERLPTSWFFTSETEVVMDFFMVHTL